MHGSTVKTGYIRFKETQLGKYLRVLARGFAAWELVTACQYNGMKVPEKPATPARRHSTPAYAVSWKPRRIVDDYYHLTS